MENRVEKQLLDKDKKSITFLFSEDLLNEEVTYKLNKVVEIENTLNKDDLSYKTGNKKKDQTYDFQKFKTITSLRREIYNDNS